MSGGKREGAGRPKGARNKRVTEQADAIAASGLTPLDYMLGILRDETLGSDARMDAAKAAAPYSHARLAAIEHDAGDGLRSMIADIIALRRAKVSELGQ